MYLKNIGQETLSNWEETLSKSSDFSASMALLDEKKTKIAYRFDLDSKTILYEAFTGGGDYFSCLVTSGKTVSKNPAFPSEREDKSLLLAYYIAKKEEAMSETERKAVYGSDYVFLRQDADLSLEDANKIASSNGELDALSKALYQSLPTLEKASKPLFSYVFIRSEGGMVKSCMYLGQGSDRKKISSPAMLLDFYKKRKKVTLGGVSVDFALLSEVPSLDFLCSRAETSSTLSDTFTMREEDFPLFLTKLVGESVGYGLLFYSVNEPVKGKFIAESASSFSLPHPPTPEMDYFSSPFYGACFDKARKELTLYHFHSLAASKSYSYLYSHPDFPYDKLGGKLATSLLPYLSKEEIEGEGYHPLSIAYALRFDESKGIICKSVYKRGDKELLPTDFLSMPEKRRKEIFISSLAALGLIENGVISDPKRINAIVEKDLNPLRALCDAEIDPLLSNGRPRRLPLPTFRLEKSSFGEWFDLKVSSDEFGEEELTLALSSYVQKKKYVPLKGRFYSLSSLDSSLIPTLMEMGLDPATTCKLTLPEAMRLRGDGAEGAASSGELKGILEDVIDYEKLSLPKSNAPALKLLRPYQASAVKWMRALSSHGLGGILADEMGLGKTLESITFLSLLETSSPILIVAPKSVLWNWKEEFAKFDPSMDVVLLPSPQKEREDTIRSIKNDRKVAYLTSYDSLRNDIEHYKGKHFSCVILDEAQTIANAFAKKSLAVKEIEADCRFALTGTPIQNSLLDLWSIFDFLLPGYFADYSSFKGEYGSGEFASPSQRKKLEAKISPFLLRRTKKEVLIDLPKREEKEYFLELPEEQRKVYDAYLSLAKGELKKALAGEGDRISVLAAITRLRQICVSPSLFLEYEGDAIKIDYLMDSLASLLDGGHKALVFSSFVSALEIVNQKLDEAHIKHGFLQGSSSAEERQEMASSFNKDPSDKVMLVSLKAGGTGLNLIGADIVFLLDPWWNLSAEEQAFARAHRIGQDKNVTVFKLIAVGTVEERMLALQKKKKDLGTVLGGITSSTFTKDDFAFLLS